MGERNITFPRGKDVARQAGVSVTTVSRVVNNMPSVKPIVRERVLATIKALNYHPNRVARRLRVRHSHVLGLIIPDIQNPFFTSVARSIEDIAYQRGYSVVLCNTDESCDKERLYVDILCAEEVAGVILATTNEEDTHVRVFSDRAIPVVTIDRQVRNHTVDSVLVSNQEGVCEAISHLIALGHTHIGFIGLPLNLTVGSERHQGYVNALEQCNLKLHTELVRIGDARQCSGYQCACELLNLHRPMTALFVANNQMTLGALDAIHEHGISIPDQLSVIGFDDMPLAAYLQPPLTTVAQPTYQLGQTTAKLLLDRIEQPSSPFRQVRLNTTLIVRNSTSAPSSVTVP